MFTEASRAVLRLSGELDAVGAGLLLVEAEPLVRRGHRHLVLVCGAVTVCNSVGLRAIVRLWGRVQPDGSVTVTRPSPTVAHILDITGLAGLFQIPADTLDPAAPSGLWNGTVLETELTAECLAVALNSTVVIEQAKGVVSERTGLDMEQSFTLLYDHAAHHHVAPADVAQRIVDGTMGTATLDPLY